MRVADVSTHRVLVLALVPSLIARSHHATPQRQPVTTALRSRRTCEMVPPRGAVLDRAQLRWKRAREVVAGDVQMFQRKDTGLDTGSNGVQRTVEVVLAQRGQLLKD